MLGTLTPEQKKDWKSHVPALVHAYNCTRSVTTGFSPYYLLFGREPSLPVDVEFGLQRGSLKGSLGSPTASHNLEGDLSLHMGRPSTWPKSIRLNTGSCMT